MVLSLLIVVILFSVYFITIHRFIINLFNISNTFFKIHYAKNFIFIKNIDNNNNPILNFFNMGASFGNMEQFINNNQ